MYRVISQKLFKFCQVLGDLLTHDLELILVVRVPWLREVVFQVARVLVYEVWSVSKPGDEVFVLLKVLSGQVVA